MGRIVRNNLETDRHTNSPLEIWLCRDHTVGRDRACSTILNHKGVSRYHARFTWDGINWSVKDLGSRNGTFVNGRMVPKGQSVSIRLGDIILYGHKEEAWTFNNDDAPRSMLIPKSPTDEGKSIVLSQLVPLPSLECPFYTIFRDGDEEYSMETDDGNRVKLLHGQSIRVQDKEYTVCLERLPGNGQQTRTSDEGSWWESGDNLHLNIAVSPDEECAELTIDHNACKHILKPKVHFYLLAYLARLRAEQTHADQAQPNAKKCDSFLGEDCGWIDCDAVCDELLINREHLAQQVFRIRKDLKEYLPEIADKVIDRRIRGKMRIGFSVRNYTVSRMS